MYKSTQLNIPNKELYSQDLIKEITILENFDLIETLMQNWLKENSKYKLNKTFSYYMMGIIKEKSMILEINSAFIFACSNLKINPQMFIVDIVSYDSELRLSNIKLDNISI